MTKKQAIKNYLDFYKVSEMYGQAISFISFGDETDAPKKAYKERNDIMNFFSMELFYRETSEEYKKIISDLDKHYSKLSKEFQRIVDLAKKNISLSSKIPAKLMEEYQKACADSNHYWKIAKNKSDYSIFAPYFEKVIKIVKEMATYYGLKEGLYYNTYLDMYEEGITEKVLDNFFNILKARIVPLLKKIQNSNVVIRDDFTSRHISKPKQLKMGTYLAKTIGYDLSKGMIKETEHPFTNRLTYNDVRFTTHVYLNNFISNLYSCAHEGGHGIYDQNINPKFRGTPLYDGASMAMHESQSRFYENIIGRSKPFCELIFPKLQKIAKGILDDVTSEEFFLAVNKVEPSFIRTESDELTYCLHIIVRYEIEKMIMHEDVDVNDLPRIWNEKYQEYLGITPSNDKEGILQDVHWTSGFGYFFSYALGNAYSAQIYKKMREDIDVDKLIRTNNLKEIKNWLKNNVYVYGCLLPPSKLIKKVTKEVFNPNYYCEYLEEKFTQIYNLEK